MNDNFTELLNNLTSPLLAIVTALIYMRTRRAGGETLDDAVIEFTGEEVPRSRWQARMRSRSSTRKTASQ